MCVSVCVCVRAPECRVRACVCVRSVSPHGCGVRGGWGRSLSRFALVPRSLLNCKDHRHTLFYVCEWKRPTRKKRAAGSFVRMSIMRMRSTNWGYDIVTDVQWHRGARKFLDIGTSLKTIKNHNAAIAKWSFTGWWPYLLDDGTTPNVTKRWFWTESRFPVKTGHRVRPLDY